MTSECGAGLVLSILDNHNEGRERSRGRESTFLFHANKLPVTELILQQVPTARTSSSLRSSPLQILLIDPFSLQVQSRHFPWFQLCPQL